MVSIAFADLHATESIKSSLQLSRPSCCCNEGIPDDAVWHDAGLLHIIEHRGRTLKQHQLQPPIDRPHVLDFAAASMNQGSIHLHSQLDTMRKCLQMQMCSSC